MCKEGGITLRLLTHENLWAARAIALRCGMITKQESLVPYACMEGTDMKEYVSGLKEIHDQFGDPVGEEIIKKVAFKAVCSQLRVLGRCTPDVKYMVVTGMKEDATIAVTGHGIHDVETLKQADVGISFGPREGGEISKEHSDIVLLDESFKSLMLTVMNGRGIYSNVRKFL